MSTTLEQSQYGFDRDSRRTWQRRALSTTQDQHYSYDALSQVSAADRGSLNINLTAISGVPASAESWDYDPTGNWRGYHVAANGATSLDQHRVHDRGNRLTQIEDNPHNMILDRVGRMRQIAPDAQGDWDGKLELMWDAWSRITSVKNNGAVLGSYAYDGNHRRVTRAVSGETLHSYYNDAWRPVEERKDVETTAASSYLWGARHRDDLVRRDRAVGGTTLNETRYVLMDYFNPAALTDASGVVKERYAFSAFGVRTILNPDFTGRSSSECAMEFGFQGQFLDVESGLMNYGYRYYSPQMGRWTCKDPIGEEGGFNLYGMVGNEAVNKYDLNGLSVSKWNSPDVGQEVDLGPCGKVKLTEFWGRHSDTVAIVLTQQGGVETGAQFQFILEYSPGTSCCCPEGASIGWKQWIISDNDPTQKKQNFPAVDGAVQYRNMFIDTPGITENALRLAAGVVTVKFKVKLGCFKNGTLLRALYENEWSISAVRF